MRATFAKYLLLGLVLAALLAGPQVAAAQEIAIRITLNTLHASSLDDGIADSTVESYGTIQIDNIESPSAIVQWNRHLCEHDCLLTSRPPYTTSFRSGRTRNWSDMFLAVQSPPAFHTFDIPTSSYRQSNNVIVIRRSGDADIARSLTIFFSFSDHDDGSLDDVWCDTDHKRELVRGGRRAQDWLNAKPATHTISARGEDGRCQVTLTVEAFAP